MVYRVAPIGALWLVATMGALMGLGQVAHSAAWWRRRDLCCWRAAPPWYLSMLGVALLRAAIMVWYHGGNCTSAIGAVAPLVVAVWRSRLEALAVVGSSALMLG